MQILYRGAEDIQLHTLHPFIGSDMVRQSIDIVSCFTDYRQSFAELSLRGVTVHDPKTTAGPRYPRTPDPAVVER
jgi:hypothetical protein